MPGDELIRLSRKCACDHANGSWETALLSSESSLVPTFLSPTRGNDPKAYVRTCYIFCFGMRVPHVIPWKSAFVHVISCASMRHGIATAVTTQARGLVLSGGEHWLHCMTHSLLIHCLTKIRNKCSQNNASSAPKLKDDNLTSVCQTKKRVKKDYLSQPNQMQHALALTHVRFYILQHNLGQAIILNEHLS